MNGTELREALKAHGIHNGRRLAEHLKCPVIFFVVSKNNRYLRAELVCGNDVLVRAPERGLTGLSQKRSSAVERARVAAEGLTPYGRDDWSRAPFSNCWVPTEKLSQLHEEFGNQG